MAYMWLIRRNSNLSVRISLIFLLIYSTIFSRIFFVYAGDKESRMVIVKADKGRVVVQETSFENEEKYFEFIKKGKDFLAEKKYPQAIQCFREGLQYAEENKIFPWNLKWRLADAYEFVGDRENFIKEIDWLIGHCENEKTKQDFINRKENFLKTHSEVKN